MNEETGLKDRISGILLGLAAGDRIGGPTRMALRLAESLIANNGFNAEDVGRRYLSWWRQDGFEIGLTAGRVLQLVDRGSTLAEAAGKVHEKSGGLTAGCNPAHRAAPLAMSPSIDDSRLPEAAIAEAALTHHDPLAGDVSAAVAVLCRALVRGDDFESALKRACDGRLDETQKALAIESKKGLSRSGYAPDVLAAAIFFLRTNDRFQSALSSAFGFAGPANYCPVLVGSIGGARWGAANIDASLLQGQPVLMSRLRKTAGIFAQGW